MSKEPIKLAVREITGFLLQGGSIDNRFGGPERAAQGSRIHRRLQKEGGVGYEAEVSLSLVIPFGGNEYLLEGRADGVLLEDDLVMVDEIKTTGAPLGLLTEDLNPAHWGQAFCYAHILAVTRNLPQVKIRLTYCQVTTGEVKWFYKTETAEALGFFMQNLLQDYERWVLFQTNWQKIRTHSIQGLAFPFTQYRQGQRQLAVGVYRTIQQGGRLFCQAPTGIGKTISTLFPSIKAMGQGLAERIFYLTAKTITRQAAEEAYDRMRQDGLRFKTVTLTAKDKICFLEKRSCNPQACPYADGYYDRVRDGVFALLSSKDCFSRTIIEEAARAYTLCPFELSLELALWCDGIICDYNYLFDPVASLQSLLANSKENRIFLIDEAHNLVDRAREMYTATLQRSGFSALKKALGKGRGEPRKSLRALDAQLAEAGKCCEEQGVLAEDQPKEALCKAVAQFAAAASVWLQEHPEAPLHQQLQEQFFEASFFLRILELYDSHYCCFSASAGKDVIVKLLCMDPSALLAERLAKGRSGVLFSATLSPSAYYRDILGGGAEAKRLRLSSPFPRQNLCLLCADQISTKYWDREDSLVPIAQLLYQLIRAKQGNYLAYFPSYHYLQQVYTVFCRLYPQVETLVQTNAMEEAEREAFLLRFDRENKGTLLGFCVLGGIFAEGVDLKGERLIGTAIIGVGLPQIGPQLEHMRQYFNQQCGKGYEYVYRYPGMNKVLQAAGRVIRGEQDKGVVLLIDSRFSSPEYVSLFPSHWHPVDRVKNQKQLEARLEAFWNFPSSIQDG